MASRKELCGLQGRGGRYITSGARRDIPENIRQDVTDMVGTASLQLNFIWKTLLKRSLKLALKELGKIEALPINPYTFLVRKMREKEISSALDVKRSIGSKNILEPSSASTYWITHAKETLIYSVYRE